MMQMKSTKAVTWPQNKMRAFGVWMVFMAILIFAGVSGCSKSSASSQKDDPHSKENPGGDDPSKGGSDLNAAYMADKKGTLLTYTIISGDEAGVGSLVEYTEIHDSLGYQVANLQAVAAGIKIYSTVRHNKDYTETINSVAPVYYQLLQTLAASFSSFTHEEKPLVMRLPHKDALKKEAFPSTVTATWHGLNITEDSKMDSKMIQTENKAVIDSSGTITTAAGTFDNCIRVHYLRTQQRIISITSPTDNYTTDNTAHFDIMIWLAKGIGPVRTIEFNMDTGITTTTDLTKITYP
jgi:hypothetical protein